MEAVATVFREHAGRLTAALVRALGSFDLAEELVQDALVTALERWPTEGVPTHPDRWLLTVARNRGLDLLRRDARYRDKLALLESQAADEDDRLRLIFTCCHPALAREAQVALTLRTVCGLSTSEIASAFLLPEPTIAQRLVRARRKIALAAIPYREPDPDELNTRLAEVLAVVYLVFNEGYLSSGPEQPERRDLVESAGWLARTFLAQLMPTEPEVLGLLALIQLHRARSRARFDEDGGLILLKDQDRSRWDHTAIEEAIRTLMRAGRMARPGRYQLEAAIVACHAEAPSYAETDWRQIVLLYDALVRLTGSPVAQLHRAIAVRFVDGPAAALAEVDAITPALARYHLWHATRAELLRELQRPEEARAANAQALALTLNPAERALLEARLA